MSDKVRQDIELLPVSVRDAMLQTWACFSYMPGLESPLPLCAIILTRMQGSGLTEWEAVACLKGICSPDSMSKIRTADDVKAALAASIQETP